MTRIAKDIIAGPIGYDGTIDPALLKPEQCQVLQNLLPDRTGFLRGNIQLANTGLTFPAALDGVGWFYNQDAYHSAIGTVVPATNPKLLTVSNGACSFWQMTNTGGLATAYPPTFTGPLATGGSFVVGQRVRFLGFGKEVYAVQSSNNIQNYRLTALNQVFPMGLSTPSLPSGPTGVQVQTVPTTPSQAITGGTGAGVPIQLTVPNHGFAVGQPVWVSGVTGNTNANGLGFVGSVLTNSFILYTNAIHPSYQFSVTAGTVLADVRAVPSIATLTQTGAFAGYVWTSGDQLSITGGNSVAVGVYTILSKINNDTVQLGSNPLTGGHTMGTAVTAVSVANAKVGNGAFGGTAPTVVPFNKTGVVQYAMTFVDALGRESDLSTPVKVDYTAGYADALITATGLTAAVAGGAVAQAYLYATTGALPGFTNDTFYRIHTFTSTGSGPDPSFEDNNTDAQVSAGGASAIAAAYGENAAPLPASLIGVHGTRVILNATTAQGVIQISNQGSATQYAVSPQQPTDGETIVISSDQGNVITGFASFGSMFAILLRRGLYVLQGDDYTTWTIYRIHDRGCIAPDSVLRADNHVMWLSDDGVYVGSYIYRFQLEKFSKPIEADLQAYNATPAGRVQLEAACAAFVNNTYVLAIGNTMYCYDFDTAGWYKLALSGSATITAMNVVQQPGTPGLLYVGLSNSTLCVLDRYTPAVGVSGMIYRTRLVQPDPSADEAAKGQTVDTLRARTKRVLVRGEGTLTGSCTITLTADGRQQAYTIPLVNYPPPPYNVLGILAVQEFPTYVWGYRRDVQLNLNGTGITIRSVEVQSEEIG